MSTEEKVLENVEKSEDSMENLLDMYEESFNRFSRREIVTGTIIALDRNMFSGYRIQIRGTDLDQ